MANSSCFRPIIIGKRVFDEIGTMSSKLPQKNWSNDDKQWDETSGDESTAINKIWEETSTATSHFDGKTRVPVFGPTFFRRHVYCTLMFFILISVRFEKFSVTQLAYN